MKKVWVLLFLALCACALSACEDVDEAMPHYNVPGAFSGP